MKEQNGFTLIETLITLSIFIIIALIFWQAFSLGIQNVVAAKNKVVATALVGEVMETVRGLTYDEIGTIAGTPPGVLPASQTRTVENGEYTVITTVEYVDDPTDGTSGGSPNDDQPLDYKKMTVMVTWPSGSVTAVEYFTPGVSGSSGSVSGGTLVVRTIDITGNPVSGVSVRVQNTTVSPPVDTTLSTGADGNATFLGLEESTQTYAIALTKSGYVSAQTYAPYPATSYAPVDVHASVVDGELTTKTIVFDEIADIEIDVVDVEGNPLPDIDFTLDGARVLGNTVTSPPSNSVPVYEYGDDLTSDSSGEVDLDDEGFGDYFFTLDPSLEDDYAFVAIDPAGTESNSFDVQPNTTTAVDIILLDKTLPSIQIFVRSQGKKEPIDNAQVRLEATVGSYDVTLFTDANGFVIFPDASEPMSPDVYDITINASGFQEETDSMTILDFEEVTYDLKKS